MSKGRSIIFAANWKMNMDANSADDFLTRIKLVAESTTAKVLVFPPSIYLRQLAEDAHGSRVGIGAQNMFWEKQGAYTGEISPQMIVDAGAKYVICGHSERRHIFNESAEMVTRKAKAAQAYNLVPVICVGETLEEREAGETLEILHQDVYSSLSAVDADEEIVIAYEPVWAIGTGQVATSDDAEQAISYIREQVRELWGNRADEISILYGGSVNEGNIAELMSSPEIDGALVGGASLNPDSFAAIIKNGLI